MQLVGVECTSRMYIVNVEGPVGTVVGGWRGTVVMEGYSGEGGLQR